MSDCSEHYEQVCKVEFAAIHTKLDRLEAAKRFRSRLIWIIVGATVTLALTGIWRLVAGT